MLSHAVLWHGTPHFLTLNKLVLACYEATLSCRTFLLTIPSDPFPPFSSRLSIPSLPAYLSLLFPPIYPFSSHLSIPSLPTYLSLLFPPIYPFSSCLSIPSLPAHLSLLFPSIYNPYPSLLLSFGQVSGRKLLLRHLLEGGAVECMVSFAAVEAGDLRAR